MKPGIKILILILVVIFIIIGIFVGSRIWLNYAWFQKLGYEQVYTKILWTKIELWFTFFIIFLAFAGINILTAFRKGGIQSFQIQQAGVPVTINKKVGAIVALIALLILGLIMARNASAKWELVLRFLHKTDFNTQDPLFGRDFSFYVFTFPLYLFLKSWALGTVILTIIAVGFLYLIAGKVSFTPGGVTVSDQVKKHILFLVMLIAIIIAWNYWLKMFQLLFSKRGLIFGAGFTDIKVVRPMYFLMIALSLFTVYLVYRGYKQAKFKLPLIGYGVLIGGAILLTGIVPGIVQQLVVKPNELVKELPYIKYNIDYTRLAYGLDKIEKKPFPVSDTLTAEDFIEKQNITRNIRLWDHRPLKSTFSQLQEFRLYYDFYDVDVDRYDFNGDYRQVMLSAREINYNEIPPEAKTWVNERLQFTHGYGVVMAPVNEVGEEGLPNLIIKDIPPKISVPLKLDRPEIYYGEETSNYVIVNTKLEEFDYPKGDKNVTTRYQGTGGIPIKNSFRRFLITLRLKSIEILFTNYINPDSRLMLYRNIHERVPKIAPFFNYDPDPYIVINDGKLFWMMDAYTTTDKIPYSQPYENRYNYIRNPVKITVDAYTGDVKFYVIDKTDPLIQTYMKIFPTLFTDFKEMDDGLKRHIRYPMELFSVQANLYTTYHMTDPQVFYNKEDKWTIPREIYGETETTMIPYYIIIKFPEDNDREKFSLILPFTPINKNNMLAWMAAICDLEDYGKIIEYTFPKEKLVYGPLQIESRIDQNAEISQLFTLWGQKGSKVIRGNLLVIPVEQSIIYVEPIYLRAEQSELPELKRVIVGYKDNIEIGITLEDALRRIFGRAEAEKLPPAEEKTRESIFMPIEDMIRQALRLYNEAQEDLRKGDFASYGKKIKELEQTLNIMAEKTGLK